MPKVTDLQRLIDAQRNRFCEDLVKPPALVEEKVYDLFASSDDEADDAPLKTDEPDGFVDADGYYVAREGSKIGNYTVSGVSGRGVFASVVRATKDG